ncbi:hypothetical protein Hanom_Chr03g00276721 [Helianthus anomalus]
MFWAVVFKSGVLMVRGDAFDGLLGEEDVTGTVTLSFECLSGSISSLMLSFFCSWTTSSYQKLKKNHIIK